MTGSSRFEFHRFPEFGQELRRPFGVHEICCGCAEFYGPGHGERGCDAWPANQPIKTPDGRYLLCLDFNRLPDVMPGEPTGQVFPSSRMNGRKRPRERHSEPAATMKRTPVPARKPPMTIMGKRQCSCGRPMARFKQCCATCRERRRKATLDNYVHRRSLRRSDRRRQKAEKAPVRGRKVPVNSAGSNGRPHSGHRFSGSPRSE